jgi:hypothetical protein
MAAHIEAPCYGSTLVSIAKREANYGTSLSSLAEGYKLHLTRGNT